LSTANPGISEGAPALSFQPQLGFPAEAVTMVGAAPEEAPGSVWAMGQIGLFPALVGGQEVKQQQVLLHHIQGTGWQVVPVLDAQGNRPSFTFESTASVTADGGIALPARGHGTETTIITHDPGGSFEQAPVPGEPVLEKGESLFPLASSERPSIFVSLDEGGHTGALVAPEPVAGSAPGVIHYDGTSWTRERICTAYTGGVCAEPEAGMIPLAIGASSPTNAWLVAGMESEGAGSPPGPPLLFKRTSVTGSSQPVWLKVAEPASMLAGGDTLAPLPHSQMLTVTGQGVWLDASLTTPTVKEADVSFLLDAVAPSTPPGVWCFPQSACGQGSLSTSLPAEGYKSFAWPGSGDGTRIIVGLEGGALLRLQGSGDFEYVSGGGGLPSADAAFVSPEEGWIASASPTGSLGAQVERVTTAPTHSSLQAWPLPFRRPLLAIASQPGVAPGDPNAQALAVGDRGQIARYIPGQGWTPEFLYTGSGMVAEPRLRGVAWPEAARAYAVGDEGAMWLWRGETGLWEPDPAAPLNFHANLTAIAFSPVEPALGYVVGKQGTLLAYNKTWTQQALPKCLEQANFTSVSFAGTQALATFRIVKSSGTGEEGGLLVNNGSGWQFDPSAQTLLGAPANPCETGVYGPVLTKVAGLPDGGAVAAGPGVVIERDSGASSWRYSPQPLPEAQNIAALAAVRAGPEVRALVSVDLDQLSNPNAVFLRDIDVQPGPGLGQPPVLIAPDPLPASGYLLRQTATGWEDVEQQAYPLTLTNLTVQPNSEDLPNWPDPVLALDVDASDEGGWAVGGQTDAMVEESQLKGAQFVSQSASALRLGSGPAPPQSASAPIPAPAGQVTLAVGGNAQCQGPCAILANQTPGPDAWLTAAISRAAQIPNVSAFLYTGARLAADAGQAGELSESAFAREMGAYRGDLEAVGAGAFPIRVAASSSDVYHSSESGPSTLSTFTGTLGGYAPAGSVPPGTPAPPAGSAAYAFEASSSGGAVRVIALDYSALALGAGQLQWLSEQLQNAREHGVPAVVMGNADIVESSAPNFATDAAAVRQALLAGGASAYLYDSPEQNLLETIGSGANTIPALGTGTLGYVLPVAVPEEFLGAGGFLLVSVNPAARNAATNRAPVTATLIPNISQLGLDALDGTLLRRSQVALFQALARRPPGGLDLANAKSVNAELVPEPYVPIPETCIGAKCAHFIAPVYTFSSSRPDVGNFVEQEPTNTNPRAVLQGSDGKPIPDSQSGLFCAFNAGTTTVSITTGGLTYSEQITVQAGSVQQPCGTVPLINPPPAEAKVSTRLPGLPPSNPPPGNSPLPVAVPPLVPPALVPPPAPASAPVAPRPIPPPFFFTALPSVPLLAAILPPPPVLARPIPPSGTSPVTVVSPAVAPKEEKEDEEAVESARNSMAVYDPNSPNLPPAAPLALIVIAAGAGAVIRSARSGRGRRVPALARARSHNIYRRPR